MDDRLKLIGNKVLAVVVFARVIALLGLFLMNGCTDLFFYPSHLFVPLPETGLAVSERWIMDDPQLLGLKVDHPRSEPKAFVLFLHGNAENVSTHIRSVLWLPQYGFSVLSFDYRGYGRSAGEINLDGALEDVCRMIADVRVEARRRKLPFGVYGSSLGGALLLGVPKCLEGARFIVLEGVFSSYPEIGRDSLRGLGALRFLFYPFSWFIRSDRDPIRLIDQLPSIPVLILHGEQDETVPVAHAHRLFQRLTEENSEVEIFLSPSARHGESWHFQNRIKEFIEGVLERGLVEDKSG